MKLEKKIYFVPVFRKFARQTNSAVIPKYKWHKNFFFLAWSSVPEYSSFFLFYGWLAFLSEYEGV